ncbi:MAG: YbcC family protein [Acidimicrobiia bacterium]
MTMTIQPESTSSSHPVPRCLHDAIETACARVAPTWPLDRFIAVNPYWGWRDRPIVEAAAELAALTGSTLTMPRAWYRHEYEQGRLDLDLVGLVAGERANGDASPGMWAQRALARCDDTMPVKLPLVTALVDASSPGGGPWRGLSWTDHAVHQIGQHAAAFFDGWQATWRPDAADSLYRAWLDDPTTPRSLRLRRGRAWAAERLAQLPRDPSTAIGFVLDELSIAPDARPAYLTAALVSVNGWAAWCAYLRWQARLHGDDDATIVELLALRLAWEWLVAVDRADGAAGAEWAAGWAAQWADVEKVVLRAERDRSVDWVLQTAVERTYQRRLAAALSSSSTRVDNVESPVAVQAIFCIDVRSEVFRRAFESVSPAVRTRGFAGFFGLPIEYAPAGSDMTSPQLPGLLAPSLRAGETLPGSAEDLAARRELGRRGERHHRWESFRHTPSSMFTFVESTGVARVVELLRGGRTRKRSAVAASATPRLAIVDSDPVAAAALGHRILTNMGLTDDFAPIVLICGHGSSTANNPHAAGLDCGACGGHAGDVNARVLAHLLNTTAVRHEIARLGIQIPEKTRFVPALHDTTTDAVTLFDTGGPGSPTQAALDELRRLLGEASARARAERAGRLGLGAIAGDPVALEHEVCRRSTDWSEVRPEWGLAGNAAYVVAPRERTRHVDLSGRAFLHDYDWRADADLSVLTLIMTAPMVVTNWINLQYFASTVDNRRYGSGNKVLHNVVGGSIGVFEGNGGDLRIGLPQQSLADGTGLQHAPLRLSVFIEAPRHCIDEVIEAHDVVRDLVVNEWLHLLRIDPTDGSIEYRGSDGWYPLP